MSVLRSKRTTSKLEVYHTAVKLRKEITLLLLRDFGIKDKVRGVDFYADTLHMTEEDKETFRHLMNEYHIGNCLLEEYPEWFIQDERHNFEMLCRDLVQNIVAGNCIYIANESDYIQRRGFQNKAIGNCENLLQEMQFIIRVMPINAEKMMRYVDMIEQELALLKGWKKADNKLLKAVKEKETKE